MAFSRQEYWSELPFPSPGDLPHPGIKSVSPTLQADSLASEPSGNLARLNLMAESGDQEGRRSLQSLKSSGLQTVTLLLQSHPFGPKHL